MAIVIFTINAADFCRIFSQKIASYPLTKKWVGGIILKTQSLSRYREIDKIYIQRNTRIKGIGVSRGELHSNLVEIDKIFC